MADTKIIDAIMRLNSSAEVVVTGTNIDTCTIDWKDGTSEISKADIQTKMDELQAEYDTLAYSRARELAYPGWSKFAEAYTEKEIGSDSTKWDAYVINYNKVRTENPK